MPLKTSNLLLSLIFITGCATTAPQQKLSSGFEYYNVKNKVFLGAQPKPADLDAAVKAGVVAVINLRTTDEIKTLKFDPKKEASSRKLKYFNIPVSKKEPLDQQAMVTIEKTVMEQVKSGPVLIHCGTGQRASSWLAVHMSEGHGMEKREAMRFAKNYGLTKEKWQDKTRKYLYRDSGKASCH